MNSQRVSVYIPTRNRSELLRRAVISVLTQSYEDVEIIIADDASDDDTEGVARDLMASASNSQTKRIVYIRLDAASGACAARNAAIAAATGKFITGLDDDDRFTPDRISRLVQAFDPSSCAFVFDGYVRELVFPNDWTLRINVPLRKTACFPDLLKRNFVGNQVLTLTERLCQVGGFDVSLPAWQDYDLWLRLVRTYGSGMPAGGLTYIHTVDNRIPRISNNPDRISRAHEIFLDKHAEYADKGLGLCLKVNKACYGFNAVTWQDLIHFVRMREPRIAAAAFYAFMRYALFAKKASPHNTAPRKASDG